MGRKNYLFCGNHDAAEDAAVIYSLMGCCKVAGVDFKKWTLHFLNHIHEYDNDVKTLDNEGIKKGPKVQFKEILGIGLAYNF